MSFPLMQIAAPVATALLVIRSYPLQSSAWSTAWSPASVDPSLICTLSRGGSEIFLGVTLQAWKSCDRQGDFGD
eukprot:2761590-Pyramimonas_sp.AAC.1